MACGGTREWAASAGALRAVGRRAVPQHVRPLFASAARAWPQGPTLAPAGAPSARAPTPAPACSALPVSVPLPSSAPGPPPPTPWPAQSLAARSLSFAPPLSSRRSPKRRPPSPPRTWHSAGRVQSPAERERGYLPCLAAACPWPRRASHQQKARACLWLRQQPHRSPRFGRFGGASFEMSHPSEWHGKPRTGLESQRRLSLSPNAGCRALNVDNRASPRRARPMRPARAEPPGRAPSQAADRQQIPR